MEYDFLTGSVQLRNTKASLKLACKQLNAQCLHFHLLYLSLITESKEKCVIS